MFFSRAKEKVVDIKDILKKEFKALPSRIEVKRWIKVSGDKDCGNCVSLEREMKNLQKEFKVFIGSIKQSNSDIVSGLLACSFAVKELMDKKD